MDAAPSGLGIVPSFTIGTPAQVVALFAALALAQGEFEAIEKNRNVVIRPRDSVAYEFQFADLAEIIACTRPALTRHGLSIVQPLVAARGDLVVQTWLLHREGGAMWTECEAPNRSDDLKVFGGRYSYLRRYQMSGLLAIAAEDDIDDNGSGLTDDERTPQAQQPGPPADPRETMRRAPAPPDARIDKSEAAWLVRKTKALSMDEAMVTAMLERLKVPPIADWAELTKAHFATVKSELNRASALPTTPGA